MYERIQDEAADEESYQTGKYLFRSRKCRVPGISIDRKLVKGCYQHQVGVNKGGSQQT